MSHFTVLVPASDMEELEATLLPYHEYECTGIEDYTEFVPADMTELQADYEQYGDGRDFDTFAKEWAGYHRNADGVWGRITNPNKKWDWWTVGGRWTGLLSTNGDSPLASDVEWEVLKQRELDDREETWREFHEALAAVSGLPIPDAILQDAHEKWTEEGKRSDYRHETWASAEDYARYNMAEKWARENLDAFWFYSFVEIADLYKPLDEYLELFKNRAVTYAFIDLDGGWNQRGEMGWWGCDDPEKGTPDYDTAFWRFVESLPNEQRIFLVDCHI
jgi:hypothetical protein